MEYLKLLLFVHLIAGAICHQMTGFLSHKQISIYGFYYIMLTLMFIGTIISPNYMSLYTRPGFENFQIGFLIHSLTMSIIFALCFTLMKGNKRKKIQFNSRPIIVSGIKTERYIKYLIFISISIGISQLILLPKVPLFTMISGGSGQDLALIREESFKLNESPIVYLWHLNRQVLSPALVLILYIRFYRHKTKNCRNLFFAILSFSVLNNAISSALAPVALIFLMLAILHYGMSKNVKLAYIVVIVFSMLLFPIFSDYMYSDMTFSQSLIQTILKTSNRFGFETADRTLSYFDLYNNSSQYLGGRTNALARLFTGLEPFNVQNHVFLYRLRAGSVPDHLLYGSANAHFIGYMNADFGLWGVFWSSVLVGSTLAFFDAIYITLRKNEIVISLYIITVTLFWKLMGTQPTTILFSHGALLMLLWAIYASKTIKVREVASSRNTLPNRV